MVSCIDFWLNDLLKQIDLINSQTKLPLLQRAEQRTNFELKVVT